MERIELDGRLLVALGLSPDSAELVAGHVRNQAARINEMDAALRAAKAALNRERALVDWLIGIGADWIYWRVENGEKPITREDVERACGR